MEGSCRRHPETCGTVALQQSAMVSVPPRRRHFSARPVIAAALLLLLLLGTFPALAQQSGQPGTLPLPSISLGVNQGQSPQDFSVTLQLVFLMTVLSLAPAILIMMTSFTRIIIVFHFIRQALGTQQIPPNQVMIGLAMFLTFFVMSPTWEAVHKDALQPYLDGKISQAQAYDSAIVPVRQFLFKHTREKDLSLFVNLSGEKKPQDENDISTLSLIPAFVLSELRLAFQIGFILYIPFLIIDMVVASVLMSMGMMMLPPVMISLPFKLLLFVLVDGWYLLVNSIISSF